MVAPPFLRPGVILEDGQAAHLAAPVDDGAVEQAALLEVNEQGGAGLVGGGAVLGQGGDEGAVLVPGLAGIEHLDVTHAALDEAAGDDAAGGVVLGDGVVRAVELEDVGGLAGDVEGLLGGGLHVGGELVAGDAGLEVQLAGAGGEVLLVEGPEQVELPLLRGAGECGGRIEIEDARLGGADEGALVEGGQPAVGEVLLLEGGQAAGVGEHHVGGQVVRLAAEAVGEPGAEGGPAGGDAPGVHGVEALGVVADAGGHGADEGDVVHDLGEVREQLADLHAALAMLLELPGGAKALGGGLGEVVVFDLAGELPPVVPGEHGLGVEEVHLGGAAHHEERDHGLRPRLEVRLFRGQVMPLLPEGRRLHRRGQQPLPVQKRGERHRAGTEAAGMEEVTT